MGLTADKELFADRGAAENGHRAAHGLVGAYPEVLRDSYASIHAERATIYAGGVGGAPDVHLLSEVGVERDSETAGGGERSGGGARGVDAGGDVDAGLVQAEEAAHRKVAADDHVVRHADAPETVSAAALVSVALVRRARLPCRLRVGSRRSAPPATTSAPVVWSVLPVAFWR